MQQVEKMIVSGRYLEHYPVITIGITENAAYAASFPSGNWYFPDKATRHVALLPLLELDYNTFKKSIEALAIAYTQQNGNTVTTAFPYEQIVVTALTSDRDYWIELSFNWLVSLGRHHFAAEIDDIIPNKRISQRVRHALMKLR